MTTAERRVALATAWLSYLAFIAYQSLAGGAPQPCATPLAQGADALSASDGVANLVAYVPLGLLVAALATGRHALALRTVGWLAVSGFSLAMEVLQACLSARVSSWHDWSMNSIGALLGLLALPIVERIGALAGGARARRVQVSPMARPALLFIGAWLAVSTAPWRFTLDVGAIRANWSFLRRLGAAPLPDPWLVAQHGLAWVAIGAALCAIAHDRRLAWHLLLATLAASLGAQALLAYRALSVAELLGGASAVVACRVMLPRVDDARLARWLTVFALGAVAAYELAPRPGAWMHAPFSWWPLLGQGSLLAAMHFALFFCWLAFALVLSLRWSTYQLRQAGASAASHGAMRARRVFLPLSVVFALLAMEWAQRWIPGRVGDTSPPLITALAFVVAWALTERIKDRDRSTSHRPVA